MSTASTTGSSGGTERPGRRWGWGYHLFAGLFAGAAIIVIAMSPQQQVFGLGFTLAALLLQLIGVIVYRFKVAPVAMRLQRRRETILYLVIAGVVLIGAYVVDWAVVRNGDVLWLAWIMAILVFVVFASGVWIVGAKPSAVSEPL